MMNGMRINHSRWIRQLTDEMQSANSAALSKRLSSQPRDARGRWTKGADRAVIIETVAPHTKGRWTTKSADGTVIIETVSRHAPASSNAGAWPCTSTTRRGGVARTAPQTAQSKVSGAATPFKPNKEENYGASALIGLGALLIGSAGVLAASMGAKDDNFLVHYVNANGVHGRKVPLAGHKLLTTNKNDIRMARLKLWLPGISEVVLNR